MRRFFPASVMTICAVLLCALALSAGAGAQPANRAKRLILKDGTYQSATQWEVKGERVRYLSAERFEWEEIPNSMVDWPATEKFNRTPLETSNDVKLASAEEARERKLEEDATPQVAPGLRLPASSGIFVLDTFANSPQLVELVQSGSEVNKQTKKNVLRAVINPVATSTQSIEIPGSRSKVQSHVTVPAIYINVDQTDSDDNATNAAAPARRRDLDQADDRYRIVRLDVKKNRRVVGNLKISMIGTVKEQETYIPTRLEPMPGGWVKLTPQGALPRGEYAVVEVLGPKQLNMFVWDFGVDPAAPANPTAWKPEPVKDTQTGTSRSPVLENRPK